MNENETKVDMEVSEAVEEAVVQTDQNKDEGLPVEESVESASGQEDAQEETEGLDDDALTEIENMKKHDAAVMLVTKTRHIINDAEKQMDACRMLLKDDLKAYDEAKEALEANALNESESLLETIGYEDEQVEEVSEKESVVFEPKEERPPFYVQDISSGKFGSFVLSLIVGAGTLAGFAYFAASKLGVTIDPSKVPSPDTLKELAGWYGTLVGGKPDLMIGGGIVAVVTLLIMWIIYGIKVSGKAKKNLAFAKQQLEDAEEYAVYKGDCKTEMDKVDAHMNEAIKVMKSYEVILEEQNGKLKRILHIEGLKEIPSEYHEKSLIEMEDTQKLVDTIRQFIATPMSEEGKLSDKSTMFLQSAKSKLQKVIERLY
jgi:hypothetical protein